MQLCLVKLCENAEPGRNVKKELNMDVCVFLFCYCFPVSQLHYNNDTKMRKVQGNFYWLVVGDQTLHFFEKNKNILKPGRF